MLGWKALIGRAFLWFLSISYMADTNSGSMDEYLADFPAVLGNYNGTLFASNTTISFKGSYWIHSQTINIELETVRKIIKTDTGLEIQMDETDETCYRFDTPHPEKTWLYFLNLHNDCILGRRDTNRRRSTTPRLQRRNSDPANNNSSIAKESHDTAPSRAKHDLLWNIVDRIDTHPFVGERAWNHGYVKSTHNNVAGFLSAGNHSLVFTGKRWILQHVVLQLPWPSIRDISRVEPSRIVVSTYEPPLSSAADEHACGQSLCCFEFIVANICNVDALWADMIQMLNDSLTTGGTCSALRPRSRSIQRRNSDPIVAQQLLYDDFLDSDNELDANGKQEDRVTVNKGNPFEENSDKSQRPLPLLTTPLLEDKDSSPPPHSWDDRVANNSDYTNVVIDSHPIDCSLDRFYELFLSDTAQFGMDTFLEGRGDSELSITKWDDTNDSRVVTYMHPVNAPLAPPEARARKEQSLWRDKNQGILLSTQTYVEDVPMTDCFYVSDRLIVQSLSETRVSITMEFGLLFVKSTMFQGLITKKTSSEFTELFESFKRYMEQAVTGTDATTPVQIVPPTPASKPVAPTTAQRFSVPTVLTWLVLGLQLYILYELRSVKQQQNRILSALSSPEGNGHATLARQTDETVEQ